MPTAHHHVDAAAPAPGADEPRFPIEGSNVGPVPAGELGKSGSIEFRPFDLIYVSSSQMRRF
jgi:hypothetical protein